VKVLYFAWLKQKTGVAEETLDPAPDVATVAELTEWLKDRHSGFAEALAGGQRIKVAVNQSYAAPGDPVGAEDEVAFFPPVTGG
jgi:molybdopterin synthase sulfur carrier subunit